MSKPSKRIPEREQLQKLFDVPERVGAVPLKLYKQLSPSNPTSKVPFFMALHLLDQGQLAEDLRLPDSVTLGLPRLFQQILKEGV